MLSKKQIRSISRSSYTVSGWMTLVLGLKGPKLNIFAIIFSFTKDGESEYFGSIEYIAAMAAVSRRTVIDQISHLVEEDLVIKIPRAANQTNKYKANLDHIDRVQELHPHSAGAAPLVVQQLHPTSAAAAPDSTSIVIKDNTSDSMGTNTTSSSEGKGNLTLKIESEKDRCRNIVNKNMGKKTKANVQRRKNTVELLPEGMDIPQALELFVNYFVVQKQMNSKNPNGVLASFDNYMERIESDWTLKSGEDQIANAPAVQTGSKSDRLMKIYTAIVGDEILEKELRAFNEMLADGITEVVFAALCVSYNGFKDEETNATKLKEWYVKYGKNKLERNYNWKDDMVIARKWLDKIK